jgi:hypothetical protein
MGAVSRWFSKYRVAVQATLLVIGVATILASTQPPRCSWLAFVLLGVGSVLLAGALLTMVCPSVGRNTTLRTSEPARQQGDACNLGLEAIHLRGGDESIFHRFSTARTIDLLGNSVKSLSYRYGNILAEAIAERGCTVRVLMSDPDSLLWGDEAIADALSPGTDLRQEIRDSLSRFSSIIQGLKRREPPITTGSIEIRVFRCLPTFDLVIVDDRFARYTPYLPYARNWEVPTYDVAKARGESLFQHCSATFTRIWAQSRTIVMEDFATRVHTDPLYRIGFIP